MANENAGGELVYVAQKGCTRFAKLSNGHPFFHVKTDDENTTSPDILEVIASPFRDLVSE